MSYFQDKNGRELCSVCFKVMPVEVVEANKNADVTWICKDCNFNKYKSITGEWM